MFSFNFINIYLNLIVICNKKLYNILLFLSRVKEIDTHVL